MKIFWNSQPRPREDSISQPMLAASVQLFSQGFQTLPDPTPPRPPLKGPYIITRRLFIQLDKQTKKKTHFRNLGIWDKQIG